METIEQLQQKIKELETKLEIETLKKRVRELERAITEKQAPCYVPWYPYEPYRWPPYRITYETTTDGSTGQD